MDECFLAGDGHVSAKSYGAADSKAPSDGELSAKLTEGEKTLQRFA